MGNDKVLEENLALEYCCDHFCNHNLPPSTICPKNLHPFSMQNILTPPPLTIGCANYSKM